jgi:hypothetical protein
MWAPWLLVAWRTLTTRDIVQSRISQTILALGGWVLVQLVATAYARGAGADYPASRYMDTLAFGATVNAVALGWLLTLTVKSRLLRLAQYTVGVAWIGTLGFGLYVVCGGNFRYELPDAKTYYTKAEGHMRRYLATNHPKQLAYPEIPFPSADGLVERLARPSLRTLMPVPIRAPLVITESPTANPVPGFLQNNGIDANVANPPRVGLSPQTPPLDYTVTWGSFGFSEAAGASQGTWTSAPLTAPLGAWLKFETAGDVAPGADGVRLVLRDANSGHELVRIQPNRRPGDTWRAAYVRAPRVPFVVAAIDSSQTEWLAFSGPVEMGRFSYWAWQATKHGRLILYLTLAVTLAIAAWGVAGMRQKQ